MPCLHACCVVLDECHECFKLIFCSQMALKGKLALITGSSRGTSAPPFASAYRVLLVSSAYSCRLKAACRYLSVASVSFPARVIYNSLLLWS